MIQQIADLILIHREGIVILLLPAGIRVCEGEGFSAHRPADGGEGVGVDAEDILTHGGNLVNVLLHTLNGGNARAQGGQHPHQDQKIFLSFHTIFLLRITSSMPSSKKARGTMPIMHTFSHAAEEELMVR